MTLQNPLPHLGEGGSDEHGRKTLLDLYRRKKLKIATAESCTGGMIAAAITDIAGSSDVFERGFVTYSNEAKTQQIGVPADLIVHHGAVSVHVAREMAVGALKHSARRRRGRRHRHCGAGRRIRMPSRSGWSISRSRGVVPTRRSSVTSSTAIAPPSVKPPVERALEMLAEAVA